MVGKYRRGARLQALVFILLALLVVFPDYFLNWISERTEWTITWVHYVVYEVFAIGLIFGSYIIFKEFGLQVNGWFPFICVCSMALIRFILWFIAREMANFEDEI